MGEQISQFDARSDAQSLAEAASINSDPSRLVAAQAAAAELKAEAEAKVRDLSKITKDIYDHPSSRRDRETRATTI